MIRGSGVQGERGSGGAVNGLSVQEALRDYYYSGRAAILNLVSRAGYSMTTPASGPSTTGPRG